MEVRSTHDANSDALLNALVKGFKHRLLDGLAGRSQRLIDVEKSYDSFRLHI
jgi:hypothetical protein